MDTHEFIPGITWPERCVALTHQNYYCGLFSSDDVHDTGTVVVAEAMPPNPSPSSIARVPQFGEGELKACPFCGSRSAPRLDWDHGFAEDAYYVVCGTDGCGARSRSFGSYESDYKAKAVNEWNTRAQPAVQRLVETAKHAASFVIAVDGCQLPADLVDDAPVVLKNLQQAIKDVEAEQNPEA